MPSENAPAWFRAALAMPSTLAEVPVAGARIAYTVWDGRLSATTGAAGTSEAAGADIVLVHGGGANARWWDHVAPQLADGRRVVALDLSGHGDSDRRADYSLPGWADEVRAVAEAVGLGAGYFVVGHSMGGFVTLRAALAFGELLGGAVVLDSAVRDVTPEEQASLDKRAFGPLRRYPSREAAIARFRPVPEQDTVLPYVGRHIAAESVRESDGGWIWKFDPAIFRRPMLTPELLAPLACRLALVGAEYGRLSGPFAADMDDRLGRNALNVELPAAGHHMMLDEPLALVAALRTLLATWAQPRTASSTSSG